MLRVRLLQPRKFIAPERLAASRPNLPQVQMERLLGEEAPRPVRDELLSAPRTTPIDPETESLSEYAEEEFKPEFEGSVGEGESTVAAWRWVYVDTLESEAMDLLRIKDMALADGERAMVIQDLASKRDLTGYINFTHLYLDGTTTHPGRLLSNLARYMRDNTKILARVRDQSHLYFLSSQLLKDPIHFMFQGKRRGGGDPERRTYLSEEEIELLGRYLRGGGFLFIDDMNGLWIEEMIIHVYNALKPDGRLLELPRSHPIYHSYYDFDDGFPGEVKRKDLGVPVPNWYFRRGEKDRPGLWGVELDGELVAVISDSSIHAGWELEGDGSNLGALMVGVNVVVYALTRSKGLTRKRLPMAWKAQKPTVPLQAEFADPLAELDDGDIFRGMDAFLALVHVPLGQQVDQGSLSLRLDGKYSIDFFKGGFDGLLWRNVPAGRHWLEVEYGGEEQGMEVELQGSKVLTATFRINRLAFFRQLSLKPRAEQIAVEEWLERFADLDIEELYYEDEVDLIEPVQ